MKRFFTALLAAILATARNWRLMTVLILLHTLLVTAGGATHTVSRSLMRVTAYCPCPKCCGQYGWGYRTASGHKIKAGDRFVAAPKNYKFGTMIDVPGYGKVPVLDRGGAIKGNRLDVYFDDHKTALQWGVKYLKVEVIK